MTTPADRPTIVITRGDPSVTGDSERLRRVTEQYLAAVDRAGGETVVLTSGSQRGERADALARMAGLLLSGGPDLSPRLYGQTRAATTSVDEARDELELEAWDAAARRGLPVLGICRGLQAINVFSGGSLIQHLEGHDGPGFSEGTPLLHRLRVVGGTQLARILRPTNPGTFVVHVNSSHHQAVGADELAAPLAASAWAPGEDDELVEGLEGRDPARFVLGIQCHPERRESTPREFERLFRFFIDAAWHTTRGIASSPNR